MPSILCVVLRELKEFCNANANRLRICVEQKRRTTVQRLCVRPVRTCKTVYSMGFGLAAYIDAYMVLSIEWHFWFASVVVIWCEEPPESFDRVIDNASYSVDSGDFKAAIFYWTLCKFDRISWNCRTIRHEIHQKLVINSLVAHTFRQTQKDSLFQLC